MGKRAGCEDSMPRTRPFDLHSDRYEDWFEKNHFAYLSELKAIRHFTPRQGDGIEIGVGSGRFSAPLGIDVGVEPSKAMRKLAVQRGIDARDGAAEQLPFESAMFDFALMVTTICFLDDAQAAFGEVARVLRPRGELIVGFVDRCSSLGRAYVKRRQESVFYRDATFYSTEEVIVLFNSAGFESIEVIQTVFRRLSEIDEVQGFETGSGEGGFVVVRGRKNQCAGS
jgi:SAM-dependent methyltransferase